MTLEELQKIVGQIKGKETAIVKIRYRDAVGTVSESDVLSIKEEITHELTTEGVKESAQIIINSIAPN